MWINTSSWRKSHGHQVTLKPRWLMTQHGLQHAGGQQLRLAAVRAFAWPQHTVSALPRLAWAGHPAWKNCIHSYQTVLVPDWYRNRPRTSSGTKITASRQPFNIFCSHHPANSPPAFQDSKGTAGTKPCVPLSMSRASQLQRQSRVLGDMSDWNSTSVSSCKTTIPWHMSFKIKGFLLLCPWNNSCFYLVLSYNIYLERKRKTCAVGLFFGLL